MNCNNISILCFEFGILHAKPTEDNSTRMSCFNGIRHLATHAAPIARLDMVT